MARAMTTADRTLGRWAIKATEQLVSHETRIAELEEHIESLTERLESVHRAAIREATRRMTPVKPKGHA